MEDNVNVIKVGKEMIVVKNQLQCVQIIVLIKVNVWKEINVNVITVSKELIVVKNKHVHIIVMVEVLAEKTLPAIVISCIRVKVVILKQKSLLDHIIIII